MWAPASRTFARHGLAEDDDKAPQLRLLTVEPIVVFVGEPARKWGFPFFVGLQRHTVGMGGKGADYSPITCLCLAWPVMMQSPRRPAPLAAASQTAGTVAVWLFLYRARQPKPPLRGWLIRAHAAN